MKEIARKALLYDFYGELLTDHQKKVYEDAVMNDYSLSELAEEYGVSRQGIHDLLKRCDAILEGYEEKLGLIKRFGDLKKVADEIRVDLDRMDKAPTQKERDELCNRMKENLSLIETI
jgi:predicted DNA-binding protein YlxM (UPF0122 family)